MIAVGLMSGTSLDGIDAARVRIVPEGGSYAVELLSFVTQPFDEALLHALQAQLPPQIGSTAGIARLHHALGEAFGRAARAAAPGGADFVASHGQTIYHDGEHGVTLQLGDPFVIRERMHATVCFDFRSADCAAGGQGAPLVPHVDDLLLRSRDEDRVALNIGGIANVTVLTRGRAAFAFDTGPGNMLLDAFVQERTGGAQRFDDGGELARRGSVQRAPLDAMLADPYFGLIPPKSTGRERFGARFLAQHAAALKELRLEDGLATLVALTAESIGRAVREASPPARVLVSGGGARNPSLIAAIAERLPGYRVEVLAAMNPDAKEAVAFAVLGYETLRERAANVPAATGARAAVPLGAIAPYRLDELLQRMREECQA